MLNPPAEFKVVVLLLLSVFSFQTALGFSLEPGKRTVEIELRDDTPEHLFECGRKVDIVRCNDEEVFIPNATAVVDCREGNLRSGPAKRADGRIHAYFIIEFKFYEKVAQVTDKSTEWCLRLPGQKDSEKESEVEGKRFGR